MSHRVRRVLYDKGVVIVNEGDFSKEGYVVRKGFVEVYRSGPPEQVLGRLGPGDIFGEMAMLTSRPRSASVRASEDIELDVIQAGDARSIVRRHPELAATLLLVLTERLRLMNDYVDKMAGLFL